MTCEAVNEQFGGGGDRAAIWRGFEAILDAETYLNLGYSAGYQSHAIGSPQRRLARRVVGRLIGAGISPGHQVIDLGCGRGGPAQVLLDRLDVRYLGVDLVGDNLRRAAASDDRLDVVQGDLTSLPIRSDSADGAISIDSFVYLEELEACFSELRRTLRPTGVAVITDLLVESAGSNRSTAMERFTEVWGFPPLRDRATFNDHLEAAGLSTVTEEDLTPNSVGTFHRWTTAYRRLRWLPIAPALGPIAKHFDLDLATIDRQVDATHPILPHLRHRLFIVVPD